MRPFAPLSFLLLAATTSVLAQAPSPAGRTGDVGARKRDPTPERLARRPCPEERQAASRGGHVDGVERSRIGLRGTEVLDRGFLAHVHLEQSIEANTGALGGPCGAAFDARATVGLSDRSWGRVDLERIDSGR